MRNLAKNLFTLIWIFILNLIVTITLVIIFFVMSNELGFPFYLAMFLAILFSFLITTWNIVYSLVATTIVLICNLFSSFIPFTSVLSYLLLIFLWLKIKQKGGKIWTTK